MASPVRLSLDRLMNRIGALGRIGAFTDPVTGDTGVCRLALTEADRMALIREFEDQLFGGCVEGMQSAGQ